MFNNKYYLILLAILSLFTSPCFGSELQRISKAGSRDTVELYLTFDRPPSFSSSSIGKRVDIFFKESNASSSLQSLEADQNIVKFLTKSERGVLVVSLFFRYKPQKHTITTSSDGKIVFEALLGNQYSNEYQDLATRLNGISVLERQSIDFTNPYILTPYKKDWLSFFRYYETPVSVSVPLVYSWPPFPILQFLPPGKIENLSLISKEMFELADNNLWEHLAAAVLSAIREEKDVARQKMYALTYGEALARGGDFDSAYKQLYLLKEEYPEELLGTYANYLLTLLRAKKIDPYIADFEFRDLEKLISDTSQLAPYFYLTRIESALATAQYKRLNTLLLNQSIALPEVIEEKIQIHQADYWYAIKQPVKAIASYKLLADSTVLPTMPYSLSGYCNTLYFHKLFKQAAQCYDRLSSFTSEDNILGSVSYKEAMARLQFTDAESLIGRFSQIKNAFPNTQSANLAAIKSTDLRFIADSSYALKAIARYKKIAAAAQFRSTAEEARFKQALIHALLGENDISITLLQKLLRESQVSDVKIPAQALLIERLPMEIRRLVENKEYVQALVLAKQNKKLFLKGWVNNQFLIDIAEAYYKIGIFNEAQKIYLYLIEVTPVDKKEDLFLPMIEATFNHGNYNLVEDYASQYSYNYPAGKYYDEILLLRIQSFIAVDRIDEALHLLPDPLPVDSNIYDAAASLYFMSEDYTLCKEVLERKIQLNNQLPDGQDITENQRFMLAESTFKSEDFKAAEQLFLEIKASSKLYEQSLYRLAEIERIQGNEKNALILFEKIVETGKSSLWKEYAERELQYAKTAARL